MHKEAAIPGLAHLRVLSDAIDELSAAQSRDELVHISAALARKACAADNYSVVLANGEHFSFSAGAPPEDLVPSPRSNVIAHLAAWALGEGQTAVVPDVHRDERTRSHSNGLANVRSAVAVPVGTPAPFAAITFGWRHEHWPAATDVLVLEALARATGLALTGQSPDARKDSRSLAIRDWLSAALEEEALHDPLQEHSVAAAELRYRMRNLLSLVLSLVRRTAVTATSAQEYAAHLEGRITALARIQSSSTGRAGIGIDLEELIASELLAQGTHHSRAVLAGPPVRLAPKAAETLALALHELTTNSVKFGALASQAGRLFVTWSVRHDGDCPRMRLEWQETGAAESTHTPAHRGFGRELIEHTVPYELRGTTSLRFGPNGAHCVIDMPLTPDNFVSGRNV